MTANLEGWCASPSPQGSTEPPWITTADCVHKFNALYGSDYPKPREAIPLSDYLATVDDAERKRVMAIVEWQPPKHRWED